MDQKFKIDFLEKWSKYFGNTELPIVFFYSETHTGADLANIPKEHSCIVCELALVRKGKALAWNVKSIGCGGARRYLGYSNEIRENFDHFLSAGIPGKMEGERYIRTPEMVHEIMAGMPCVPAMGRYIIFKRFDQLTPDDEPVAVLFFAKPDVLSGLFMLANYDQTGGNGVMAPFGSGCSVLVHHPYLENEKENPKAVLGMFDPSARPCVPKEVLSFAVPMKKFVNMAGYMDECFLITDTWKTVKKRI